MKKIIFIIILGLLIINEKLCFAEPEKIIDIKINKKSNSNFLENGNNYLNDKKYELAITELLKGLKSEPKNIELKKVLQKAKILLGLNYINNNKELEGIKLLREGIKLIPNINYKTPDNLLAAAVINGFGQPEEAIKILTKIDEKDPLINESKILLCHSYINMSKKYFLINNYDQSIKILNQSKEIAKLINDHETEIIALNSKLDELIGYNYSLKGMFLLNKKNALEAIHNFNIALKYSPNEMENYRMLSMALFLNRQSKEAFDTINSAIEKNPDNAENYYALSLLYCMNNEKNNCLENIVKSVNLDKNLKLKAKTESAFKILKTEENFINNILKKTIMPFIIKFIANP